MTQRRNRSLDRLRATWGTENQQNKPDQSKTQKLTRSHTVPAKNEAVQPPHLPTLDAPSLKKATPQPKPKSNAKRIYMNVVLNAELERRLERAVAFYQKSLGKAFGKSAYGRKALLAQLERDGF